MTKEWAIKLALEALEKMARLTGPQWALEKNYSGHLEAIATLHAALAEQPAQQRPQNCGTGYCSCIECLMKPSPVAWLVEFENGEQELHFEEQPVGEINTPLYTSHRPTQQDGALINEGTKAPVQALRDALESPAYTHALALQNMRKALELVLSWIDDWCETGPETGFDLIEEKAKAALAEQPAPAQGWKLVPIQATREIEDAIGRARNLSASDIWEDALAAAPQPAQRKPLTDEEIECMTRGNKYPGTIYGARRFARAIEAAHNIKETP